MPKTFPWRHHWWRCMGCILRVYSILPYSLQPLLQIMACRLIGAITLSETMLSHCQLDPKKHISGRFYLKFKSFRSRKYTWKFRLRNDVHFVSPQCDDEVHHIWSMRMWMPSVRFHTIKWNKSILIISCYNSHREHGTTHAILSSLAIQNNLVHHY